MKAALQTGEPTPRWGRGWRRGDTLLLLLVLGLAVPRAFVAVWEMTADGVSQGAFGPLTPPPGDGESWILAPLPAGRAERRGREGLQAAEEEARVRGFALGDWASPRAPSAPRLLERFDGSAVLLLGRVGRLCRIWDPVRGEVALYCPALRQGLSGRSRRLVPPPRGGAP